MCVEAAGRGACRSSTAPPGGYIMPDPTRHMRHDSPFAHCMLDLAAGRIRRWASGPVGHSPSQLRRRTVQAKATEPVLPLSAARTVTR